ncbi:MAG: hypothetical protein ABW174_06280 [Flavitalea sp.]
MINISTFTRLFTVSLLATTLLGSCLKDKVTRTYAIYEAIYQTKDQVLSSVKSSTPVDISTPGKLYIYGKYIFLNEINKGVHIIDNANPSAPKNIGFINIPGNVDIAVKGSILYADMYSDLLTIDISDPTNTRLVNNLPRIFPDRYFGVGYSADTSKVVVGWTKRDTTMEVNAAPPSSCFGCYYEVLQSSYSSASPAGSGAPGIGGSMARFSIVKEYMYAVGNFNLQVLSIANPTKPQSLGSQPVGFGIETIYPFKDKLFIGSSNGMFIYSLSDPQAPSKESSFEHARACDPVVADDQYAFVTLRSGNACGGTFNVLEVIDVSDISQPKLLKSHSMSNPHGLAMDGNNVFVCDGKDGLKMLDVSDPLLYKELDKVSDIETYDVIAWNNTLLVVTKNGLNQYDYSDRKKMRFLSTLTINKKL